MSCACSFTGSSACHCAGCHSTFSSVTAFDLHQRLDDDKGNVCLAPAYARDRKGRLMFKVVRAPGGNSVWGRNAENTAFPPARQESEPLSPAGLVPAKGAV
jgi:hypothetical protein